MAKQQKKQAQQAAPSKTCAYTFACLKRHVAAHPGDTVAAAALRAGPRPGRNRKPTIRGLTRMVRTTNEKGQTETFTMTRLQQRMAAELRKLNRQAAHDSKKPELTLEALMLAGDVLPVFKRV